MAAVEPVRPPSESLHQRAAVVRRSTWHSGWHFAAVAVTSLAGAVLGVSVADVGNAILRLVLVLFVLILLVRHLRAQ